MTLAEALEKISKALGVFAMQVQSENKAGFFSKNRLCEDLVLPLFRELCDAPGLRNLNRGGQPSPYIDLADEDARLAIQVTTERTASKISETLTGFLSHGYQRRFDRLVFFLLAPAVPRYASKTKAGWRKTCGRRLAFDPTEDIVAINDLFRLAEGLPQPRIFAVAELIASSVIGDEYFDLVRRLAMQPLKQVAFEKKSGKYIPDIFVETRETKNLARCFCHPVLFVPRTTESLARLNIAGCNRKLTRAGLKALPPLLLKVSEPTGTLDGAMASVADLENQIAPLSSMLKVYEHVKYKDPPPYPIPRKCQPFYEANFTAQHDIGWGLRYQLEKPLQELRASRARVFILIGRAGQGKTNFVCDLVENFLARHQIPCAFLTGRQISAVNGADLADVVLHLVFDRQPSSFRRAARLLSAHADALGKPFVLVIDGLNEHHRLAEFADELEQFIQAVLDHRNLKLLLTCRSEFFEQRFGRLVSGHIGESTFLWDSGQHRVEDAVHDEMLSGYFRFFGIDRKLVSPRVLESLDKDVLLLRFFCEAYGTRGKPTEYRQPVISSIYRDQIFRIYLEAKLGTANAFLQRITATVRPTSPRQPLLDVLGLVLEHMLDTWQFMDVPASVIPKELHDALYALLDEDLILRRDAPHPQGVFAPSTETINFTFDEFRDFLLAQFLISRVYATDVTLFESYVRRSDPQQSSAVEGVKKFLFYGSRQKGNDEFWRFYRDKPWYSDAFDDEVFNIDPVLLKPDDTASVLEGLRGGGARAQRLARSLAPRWNARTYPALNLEMLLEFVSSLDESQYDDVIREAFRSDSYYNERVCARAFCAFLDKELRRDAEPIAADSLDALFRFLVLLLPLDADSNLNSRASDLARRVLARRPARSVELLVESLSYTFTQHRPHVWRLLSLDEARTQPAEKGLLARARSELANGPTNQRALHQELRRFLERSGEEPIGGAG